MSTLGPLDFAVLSATRSPTSLVLRVLVPPTPVTLRATLGDALLELVFVNGGPPVDLRLSCPATLALDEHHQALAHIVVPLSEARLSEPMPSQLRHSIASPTGDTVSSTASRPSMRVTAILPITVSPGGLATITLEVLPTASQSVRGMSCTWDGIISPSRVIDQRSAGGVDTLELVTQVPRMLVSGRATYVIIDGHDADHQLAARAGCVFVVAQGLPPQPRANTRGVDSALASPVVTL